MRLERIEMKGFGAFRDATEIDFDGADFFALVGPTGAGKSTIIDALCFALYGNVPRYEDKRLNRYVITLGASEARVSLRFELAGRRYAATRVVRRTAKGAVSTREARLELLGDDGSSTVLAGAEREMDVAVLALVQLDFDDFTRCVVLPQGEFARFLRSKGDERRGLLVKLLNLSAYTTMGQLAGQRAEAARAAATLRRQQLANLAFASAPALSAAQRRARSIAELASRASRSRPEIEEALRHAAESLERTAVARGLIELLGAAQVPAEVREHGAALEDAARTLAEAEVAEAAARERRMAFAAASEAMPDLVVLRTAAEAHADLARTADRLAVARAAAGAASAAEAEATFGLAEAEGALDEATANLRAVDVAHLAGSLAQQLVLGEPCPVCSQVVTKRPKLHVPIALGEAKKAEVRAKGAVNTARKQADAAARAASEASGTIRGLEAALAGLRARIERHPDVGSLESEVAAVEEALAAVAAARTAEASASAAVAPARAVHQQLVRQSARLRSAYGSKRDALVPLGPPSPGHIDLLADWTALAEWAEETVPQQRTVATEAAADSTRHRSAAADKLDGLTIECLELDVPASGGIVAVVTALAEAGALARSEAERIERALAEAATVGVEVAGLDEQAEVAAALRNLLRSNNFPEWLIAEALELLVLEASATLRALTNDQFSLDLGESEFMVIDHANADERRSARTLSGGETFQASLALALALSDQIRNLAADGAPPLDALFLDEGFGTLDPETLDAVAATIESLGRSGRMVGIITHVRELAARVPVRYEVRKGPRSATVERLTK